MASGCYDGVYLYSRSPLGAASWSKIEINQQGMLLSHIIVVANNKHTMVLFAQGVATFQLSLINITAPWP